MKATWSFNGSEHQSLAQVDEEGYLVVGGDMIVGHIEDYDVKQEPTEFAWLEKMGMTKASSEKVEEVTGFSKTGGEGLGETIALHAIPKDKRYKGRQLWPQGKVPYKIELHDDLMAGGAKTELLDSASQEIKGIASFLGSKVPGVTLYPLSEKTEGDSVRIEIFPASSCYGSSWFGFQFSKGWPRRSESIRISASCFYDIEANRHLLYHEILHALGVHHEHQRPERDEYIKIHNSCIAAENKHSFEKITHRGVAGITPYDFESIMHYSSFMALAVGGKHCPAMTKKDGANIEDNRRMSALDIKGLNILYPPSARVNPVR